MTAFAVNPVLSAVYAALVPFIQQVTGLPPAQVVLGLGNRTPMPAPGFIAVQAITRHRLRTNLHSGVTIAEDESGSVTMEEGVELTVQIDCYSTPVSATQPQSAEDWATMLSTTLRDAYGCSIFPPNIQPLFADDARMIPLVAGEEQYEERWSLEAHFQYNPQTTVPQQYADVLDLELIDVPNLTPQ